MAAHFMATMAAEAAEPPPAKKARTVAKSWKLFLTQNLGRDGRAFGLHDLFASGFADSGERGANNRSAAGAAEAATARGAAGQQADKFYTLRLEHRQGGPMAQHRGEERILLFRSDRPGAIAKIIYSSELPDGFQSAKPPAQPANDASVSEVIAEAAAIAHLTAHAKIHVLDVKSQYRGRDLGGLLFSEAITSLKSKYCNDDDDYEEENISGPIKSTGCKHLKQLYDVECMLDAEEDVTRHGKLISFYEHLGCRVKPTKRVQYVNNNDSETYRKVPMQIDLHPLKANSPSKLQRARVRRRRFSDLSGTKSRGSFLPVQLVGSLGKLNVRSHNTGEVMKLDWLVTESADGMQFCTTHGHLLLATPNGAVSVLSPDDLETDGESDLDIDTDVLNKWTTFVPCHVSDEDGGGKTEGCEALTQLESSRSLWVLRTCHGTFLTADSLNQTLSCTKLPSFWQANGANLSLVCTSDTPPRRHHYRKGWKIQTFDYVASMKERFLNFSLGKVTLLEALGWIDSFPAHPFHAWADDEPVQSAPSLRTLCFLMAEVAREEGLPDWVQFIALIHELGEAVKILDPTHTGEMAESIYDWTISSRSRVIGCKIPQRATFREFRHLNMDEDDARFASDTGVYQEHCGLENVSLMWSGCEYMYHLLRHNNTLLPDEALELLRYHLLGDWHEHGEYSSLTNEHDADVLPFVQQFDSLRRRVRLRCVDCGNLTDDQCNYLWDSHYALIAGKFDCDRVFDW
ncbi:hypothetical protein ACHAXT_010341 [Thalassiosira profunda]